MFMEEQIASIMRLILLRLIKMDKWSGAHTALRNATKGLPSRYLSTSKGKKAVKKALKELTNKGFLLVKPSTDEIHISLDSHKAREIDDFLQKVKNY